MDHLLESSSETNNFGVLDYVIVACTLGFSLLIGIYYSFFKKQETNEDMNLGGRTMNPLPIAASILVTYLSAINVLGYPSEIREYGVQFFVTIPFSVMFFIISGYTFIPFFYNLKITSVFQYLENRFESKLVRKIGSFVFILQIVLWNGVVLYTPSLALEAFVGLPMWISTLGVGVIGTVYTSMGGFRAVVWTDVFQFFMIMFGMLAIIIRGFYIVGFSNAFAIAEKHGRINFFNFKFDPFERLNFWNIILGNGFLAFILGTHQLQVQRYCSLPSAKIGIKSLYYTLPLWVCSLTLTVLAGISIFAVYAGCDPILLGNIKKSDQIVPYFVVNQMAFIPGMVGLFSACVFSAVLSTVSSALNSLSAVTYEDFLSDYPFFHKMGPKSQANVSRILCLLFGLICVLLAFAAPWFGSSILEGTFKAAGTATGPLAAVFLLALFFPFVNKQGAISGMILGVVLMLFNAIQSFLNKIPDVAQLETNVDQCPEGLIYNKTGAMYLIDLKRNMTSSPPPEWPKKLYSLSYILYPITGAIITLISGIIISILTGGLKSEYRKKVNPYIHPWVKRTDLSKTSELNLVSSSSVDINISMSKL